MPTAIARPWPSGPVVDLDARQLEILRMAGARAAELAEVPDVVDRRPRVAGQVQQRVDQHRAVAGRQDETVAVGPVRIGGVELQMPGEQRGRGVGHAHRHARVAAVGGLHRIHREGANGVGEAAVGRLHRGSVDGVRPRPGIRAGARRPFAGEPCQRQRLPGIANLRSETSWTTAAFPRSRPRRARARSGSSGRSPTGQPAAGRDEELRAKVREAVAELDQLIREAAADGRDGRPRRSPGAPIRSPAARARKKISAPPPGWSTARAARRSPGLGTLCEARQFLFASLLLADQLIDKRPERRGPAAGPPARPGAGRARRSARRRGSNRSPTPLRMRPRAPK